MGTERWDIDCHPGSLVAVVGPPGSGKTAAAERLAEITAARGGRVGWGSAWPGDPAAPLWHWRAVAACLGVELPVNGVCDPADLASRVLYEMARPPQVLVVVDDLDLADVASITLLRAVARSVPAVGGAVVATMSDPSLLDSMGPGWRRVAPVPSFRAPCRVEAIGRSREVRLTDQGGLWAISTDATTIHLRHSKGMTYLANLVALPGQEIHALELASLAGAAVSASGLEVADVQAVSDYRRRILELAADLEEADAANDLARASTLRAELDHLTVEVTAAVGLGGRTRRTGDAAERARLNVTRAIRSAIDRIGAVDDTLGVHLVNCVKTGLFCAYRPDRGQALSWNLAS